jgi:hypothetical protein
MAIVSFKNRGEFVQFLNNPPHPILKQVLNTLMVIAREDDLVFTSTYRPGDKGVHGTVPLRAVDIRVWNLKKNDPEDLVTNLNNIYIYDPERPGMSVAVLHDVGSGPHIHIQVHPNTKIR